MSIIFNLLLILFVYLSYLLIWFIVNLLAYFVSLAFKTPKILILFVGTAAILYYIFSFLLGLYLLWITISLLLNGQFLWFLVMSFIGLSIIYGVIGFLQMPFMLIPSYFLEKLEKFDSKEDIVRAEILDDKDNVLTVTEGEATTSRRLAIWFLIAYGINLFSLVINRQAEEYQGYRWGDYILTPTIQILTQLLVFGIFVGIFYKLRKGKFFFINKRYFITSTLKVSSIIFGILIVIYLFLGIWTIK